MCGVAMLSMAGSLMAQTPIAVAVQTSLAGQQGAVLKFSLPAEPLAETLHAIGQRSGRSVQFNPADVEGVQAPALHGEFTAVAAIQKAVAGSKLYVSSAAGGGWIVFVPDMLDTVVVTAKLDEAETGFQATRSDTATRSGTDLMNIPESVTIITSDVLKSQQTLSVLDALQNVSGAQVNAGAQGTPFIQARGLPISTLTNGMTNPFALNADVAGVERIEVLKGPQAILSGGDSLGGAVNIVTKKPTADPLADVSLQYGTFGDKTAIVDLSDGLADNGQLSGRVIGSWTRATASDAGYDGRKSNYFLPQLRWKNDSTDLVLGASYDKEDTPLGRYTFALTGSIAPIPTMRLGNKNNGVNTTTKSVFYTLEHKFAPWLTLVSRTQQESVEQDLNVYNAEFPLDIPSGTYAYVANSSTSSYRNTSSDNYLRLSFNTGPLKHVLSTGLNFTSLKYKLTEYSLPDFSSVDVYANQQFNFPYLQRNNQNLYSVSSIQQKQYGLYAQDLITEENWHALLNIRRDYYQSGPGSNYYPSYNQLDTFTRSSVYQTTQGAGVVYDVTPDLNIYGSYMEGYSPNFTYDPVCGSGLVNSPPQESRNIELGVKTSTPDGQLSLTSSVFVLNQMNVLQYNQGLSCDILIKGQRTRGLEFDAQGQLTKGWNLVANYSYNLVSNIGAVGEIIPANPRNKFSLWSTYDFPDGPLRGFGVGAGITAYSKSYADFVQGAPTVPGGARTDASIYYHPGKWSFTLGVKNVFDRTLYGLSPTPMYIPVNLGRTTTFTMRYRFF
jgi:iron complex outermembrane receptor protein